MYKVIVFSLLVFLLILFFFTKNHSGSSSLNITSLTEIPQDQNISEVPSERPLVRQLEEKSALKEVAMSDEQIEQLKLNDFHAYLRHEQRVKSQQDAHVLDAMLNPEDRKKIAKERLAVRLIEELNAK